MNPTSIQERMRAEIPRSGTLPIRRMARGGLWRKAITFLLVGAATLAPVIDPPTARADVSITISNQGSQLPGGTAVPVMFTDLTIRLTDGTILRPVVPGDPTNATILPGRVVGQVGGPAVITVPGIDATDIALVTPSRRVGTGKNARDVPAGGILRPTVRQLISIPEMDDAVGNLLVLLIDASLYQDPPPEGTVLNFVNGLTMTRPDWFLVTSFDETTMTAGSPYTGDATVALPFVGVAIADVPEPSSLLLAGVGLIGLLACVGRRRGGRGTGQRAPIRHCEGLA